MIETLSKISPKKSYFQFCAFFKLFDTADEKRFFLSVTASTMLELLLFIILLIIQISKEFV